MQESAVSDAPSKASGLLSSFVRNIGVNVMGTQSLALEDIQSALEQLKKKLMERNVAEEIAAKYVPCKAACSVKLMPLLPLFGTAVLSDFCSQPPSICMHRSQLTSRKLDTCFSMYMLT